MGKTNGFSWNGSMKLDKETKGTIRYSTDDDQAPASTVYVRKFALPKPYPAAITVTLEA